MHSFKTGGPTKVQYLCLGIHGRMNHTLRRQLKILSTVKIKAYFTKENLDLLKIYESLTINHCRYISKLATLSREGGRSCWHLSLAAYSVKK